MFAREITYLILHGENFLGAKTRGDHSREQGGGWPQWNEGSLQKKRYSLLCGEMETLFSGLFLWKYCCLDFVSSRKCSVISSVSCVLQLEGMSLYIPTSACSPRRNPN